MALPAQRVDAIRSIMAQARAVGGVEREMAATLSVLAANAQSRIDVLEATATYFAAPTADLFITTSATMGAIPGMAVQLDSLGYDLLAFFSCELYNTSTTINAEAAVALYDNDTLFAPAIRTLTLPPDTYASTMFAFQWHPPAGLRTLTPRWSCAAGAENIFRCTAGRMQLSLIRLAFGGL